LRRRVWLWPKRGGNERPITMTEDAKPKWTPGPWTSVPARKIVDGIVDYIGAVDYGIAADVGGKKEIIAEAFGQVSKDEFTPAVGNANIIAAAPELYEALEKITNYYLPPVNPEFAEVWNAARAALRKARGE